MASSSADRVTVESKLSPTFAPWVIQALGRLALTCAVILGVVIVLGGRERFAGPSFAGALSYPGAPASWGYVLGALGLVGIVSSLLGGLRVTRWTLYGMSVWALFFAYSFIQTAARDDQAGTTGIVIYIYVAVNAIVLGAAHKR